jgi:hypothetical protein
MQLLNKNKETMKKLRISLPDGEVLDNILLAETPQQLQPHPHPRPRLVPM